MGIPSYFLLRNVMGNSNAATVMVLLMLPAFLFAMYEKDGMHLEDVLMHMIRVKFLRPPVRKYETEINQALIDGYNRQDGKLDVK